MMSYDVSCYVVMSHCVLWCVFMMSNDVSSCLMMSHGVLIIVSHDVSHDVL